MRAKHKRGVSRRRILQSAGGVIAAAALPSPAASATARQGTTGGAGTDVFAVGITGTISDFASGIDKIRIDGNAYPFSDVGATGNFAPGDERFHAAAGATTAHDATDRMIYNTSTGDLYYDSDGTGSAFRVLVATLQGQPM